MASTFSLKVIGLDSLTKKIHTLPTVIQDGLDRALNEASNAWVNGAVRDAPVYDGKLRSSIRATRKGYLWYSVSSNVFYAPYVEFGTKRKARVPGELQAIAAEYRGGKAGSFKDLLAVIEKWVRKKRIRSTGKKTTYKQTAFFIAMSIAKNGINPHPYFFKQKQTAQNIVQREVVNIYKQIQNG